ncbi:MAG: hypothetical protein LC789_08755 [Actinobacteria bacterium]|nr:hypothetical protein [Actinomycetota bacterium]MCA1720622.1 hypothetical protein [Actinomycetota bacterium]
MSAEAGGGADDVNALAAALRSQSQDSSLYAGMLLNTLSAALPTPMVTVERERGLRLMRRGRPAAVTAVTVSAGERKFELRRDSPTAVPRATVQHIVRGIVLSSDTLSLTAWTTALARELTQLAARDRHVAEAIERLVRGAGGPA